MAWSQLCAESTQSLRLDDLLHLVSIYVACHIFFAIAFIEESMSIQQNGVIELLQSIGWLVGWLLAYFSCYVGAKILRPLKKPQLSNVQSI